MPRTIEDIARYQREYRIKNKDYLLSEQRRRYHDKLQYSRERSRKKKQKTYLTLRSKINRLKEQPCNDCQRRYPFYVSDFDHRSGEEKLFTIGRAISDGRSLEAILSEIAKCDLVCANCHRIRTRERGQHISTGKIVA